MKNLMVTAMMTMACAGGWVYTPPPSHPIIGKVIYSMRTDAGVMKVYRNEIECLLTINGEFIQAVDLEICSR